MLWRGHDLQSVAYGEIVLGHAQRYPPWDIVDLYKLLHQAAMGAEHALSSEAGVREWLTRELAELSPEAAPDEPLIDPTSPDGQLVRVHLRPFARLGLDPEPLLQAFFRTATGNKPAPERLVEFAETAVEHAYRVVARALLPEELLCA